MQRRIVMPTKYKDPKRQEAAKKAHETMRREKPAKLKCEIAALTWKSNLARERMVRAFNRWQKLEARLKVLQKRLAETEQSE